MYGNNNSVSGASNNGINSIPSRKYNYASDGGNVSSVANRAAAGELLCMCLGVAFTLTRTFQLNILLYILFYFEWSGTPHSFAHTNDSVNPSLQAQRREKVFCYTLLMG